MIPHQLLAEIPCGPGLKCASFVGYLVIAMAFVLFVGSIYLLLAAVFGRRMGYLVLAVAFFGWMLIFSSIWAWGLFSQGPTTKTNLGPRGTEPHWQALGAGVQVASPRYPVVSKYPGPPWVAPHQPDPKTGEEDPRATSVATVTTAVQDFLADETNRQLKDSGQTVLPTDFTVSDIRFATAGHTSLAAARAVFNGGGPSLVVFAYHDSGSVPIYSYAFFIASALGLAIHLPFLDRAERKRKAVLTGGKQPPFLGPA
jgi:hypothetical protein